MVATFLNPLSLSSFATGPNILFPIGSLFLPMIAIALSSKRTQLPSDLLSSFFVLTTTPHCTEADSICPVGEAFLIATTTMSPTVATFTVDQPKTLITCAVLAPVLSATITFDSCAIILVLIL